MCHERNALLVMALSMMMMAKVARAPKANIFTFLFDDALHERWCPNGILQPPICADQVHLSLHHNHSKVVRFTEVFIASTTIMVTGFALLLPSVLNYQHVNHRELAGAKESK
jgi:hypothetical protein